MRLSALLTIVAFLLLFGCSQEDQASSPEPVMTEPRELQTSVAEENPYARAHSIYERHLDEHRTAAALYQILEVWEADSAAVLYDITKDSVVQRLPNPHILEAYYAPGISDTVRDLLTHEIRTRYDENVQALRDSGFVPERNYFTNGVAHPGHFFYCGGEWERVHENFEYTRALGLPDSTLYARHIGDWHMANNGYPPTCCDCSGDIYYSTQSADEAYRYYLLADRPDLAREAAEKRGRFILAEVIPYRLGDSCTYPVYDEWNNRVSLPQPYCGKVDSVAAGVEWLERAELSKDELTKVVRPLAEQADSIGYRRIAAELWEIAGDEMRARRARELSVGQ